MESSVCWMRIATALTSSHRWRPQNAALNSFNKVLLANHIRTCVAEDIREGKDETIDELVVTLQKLMK